MRYVVVARYEPRTFVWCGACSESLMDGRQGTSYFMVGAPTKRKALAACKRGARSHSKACRDAWSYDITRAETLSGRRPGHGDTTAGA